MRQLQTDRLRLAEALDRTRTALAVLVGEEAPRFVLTPAPLDALAGAGSRRRPSRPSCSCAGRTSGPPRRGSTPPGATSTRARRAFFPRSRLSASALGQAASLSGPLARHLSLGAGLLAPIFDRGRLTRRPRIRGGRQVESVELYRPSC